MNKHHSKLSGTLAEKIGFILGVIIVFAIPIVFLWVLWLFWIRFNHMTPNDWDVLGDVVRNTSGLVALGGALLTIRVMRKTNIARAREATSSEFRDQMQWAADSLASNEPIKMIYAQLLIQRYAEDKPELLSDRDHRLVLEMWDLSQALYGKNDADNLEDDADKGQNESN